MSLIKAAWIQGKSQGNIKQNLKYYSEKILECRSKITLPLLVVLPELFLWDYFPITEDKKHFDTALTINSNEVKHFQLLAKELKIVLVLPVFEKSENGSYYNSCLVIEKDGSIIGHYCKMHIPYDPGFYEKYYFSPGDKGFVVVHTSVGKIGVMICYDQWFPEAARINALQGADILIYPTAIAWDMKDTKEIHDQELDAWITAIRSNAITNNVHAIAANRVGQEGYLKFWGNSFLVDPFGKLIHRDDLDETISTVEIDLSKTEKCRKVWTFFRDRRVDNYKTIIES